jgi:hypothetical protein
MSPKSNNQTRFQRGIRTQRLRKTRSRPKSGIKHLEASNAAPMSDGILPNEAADVRLLGALLLEQNDKRATQRVRYMT